MKKNIYRSIFLNTSLFFALASGMAEDIADADAAFDAARAAAPELQARSAVLMDAATGVTLYAKNADQLISPASLTKLMTIHVALEQAKLKGISLDDKAQLPPESWAVNQPPRSSLMFLAQDQIVSIRELFLGLAVPSGNDAAVAVALNFAPTVDAFVDLMNQEAENMGLIYTHFVEPSGISEDNWTTAREWAIFCREYIRLHPENLSEYHSIQEFAYPKVKNVPDFMKKSPRTIVQKNHIGLLNTFPGVDGLKTGYIDEAGYNIALTADRDGTRFVAVILSVPASLGAYWGSRARDADGRALLQWGFDNFKTIRPPLPPIGYARVWKGVLNQIGLIPENKYGDEPLAAFTVLADRGNNTRWEVSIDDLIAPVEKGETAGSLVLYDDIGELERIELVSANSVERGNFLKRAWDSIRLFFRNLFK